jgi:cytochrome bd ubiquinol oxidase subunit II
MSLDEYPLVLIVAGLTAYAVLGGADFGAGFWTLPAGGRRGEAIRDQAHHAMGPVWEANHVWLIFVLVVFWTGYPTAFASIMSTLAVLFFIAAVGIILRGTAYALRAGTGKASEQRTVDLVFALSSIITPFALGAAIGAIASGRVPVGNAEGDPFSSWLNATSVFVGVLAVAVAAYLAAVYLAADAVRAGETELAEAFRVRALVTGVVAGAVAMAGLIVVHEDAPELWDGLSSGAGLGAVIVSAIAGAATMLLVWSRRYEAARPTAAAAVGAIVLGWAFAQRPEVLPGLDVHAAAAGRSTLWALVIATAIGAVLLVPSLLLLYGFLLRGLFDTEPAGPEADEPVAAPPWSSRLVPVTAGLLVVGALLTFLFDTSLVLAIGVAALLGFAVCGFLLLTEPSQSEGGAPGDESQSATP